MNTNITFLNIVAEYCNTPADEITNDMRFIEDLGFSSLDFMTFLGDFALTAGGGRKGDAARRRMSVSGAKSAW